MCLCVNEPLSWHLPDFPRGWLIPVTLALADMAGGYVLRDVRNHLVPDEQGGDSGVSQVNTSVSPAHR